MKQIVIPPLISVGELLFTDNKSMINLLPSSPESEEEQPKTSKKSNKKIVVIVSSIFLSILLVVITVSAALLLAAPSIPDDTSSSPSEGLTASLRDDITFDITQNETVANYIISTPEITNNIFLEYRIENTDKRVLAEGTLSKNSKSYELTGTINLNPGENQLTLKTRESTPEQYGKWEVISKQTIFSTEEETSSDLEVNPAFFETRWANQEEITIEALSEAVEIAYGATPVEMLYQCGTANYAQVEPGEVFSPKPKKVAGYKVAYQIFRDNPNFGIQYFFCPE